MRQQDKVTQTIKNTNLSAKYRGERKKYQDEKKAHDKDNKDNATTIKELSDINGVLESEVNRLTEELRAREEQESYIICKNDNGAITHITHTHSFNERIEYDDSIDINVVNSKAYQQSPFYKVNGNKIVKDKEAYNKYLIIGGIL